MRIRLIFPFVAVSLVLTGCTNRVQTDQLPIAGPSTSAIVNAHATLTVPSHVKHLTNVPFTLSLSDSQTGKPISDARVTVGLTMPSMDMPLNIVRLNLSRPGVYTGTGIFTMPGSWQATAVYLDSSGNEGSKPFPVQVK